MSVSSLNNIYSRVCAICCCCFDCVPEIMPDTPACVYTLALHEDVNDNDTMAPDSVLSLYNGAQPLDCSVLRRRQRRDTRVWERKSAAPADMYNWTCSLAVINGGSKKFQSFTLCHFSLPRLLFKLLSALCSHSFRLCS